MQMAHVVVDVEAIRYFNLPIEFYFVPYLTGRSDTPRDPIFFHVH